MAADFTWVHCRHSLSISILASRPLLLPDIVPALWINIAEEYLKTKYDKIFALAPGKYTFLINSAISAHVGGIKVIKIVYKYIFFLVTQKLMKPIIAKRLRWYEVYLRSYKVIFSVAGHKMWPLIFVMKYKLLIPGTPVDTVSVDFKV